jgi:hypothetical protein
MAEQKAAVKVLWKAGLLVAGMADWKVLISAEMMEPKSAAEWAEW